MRVVKEGGMGRAFAAFSPQRALICTRMVPQLDLEVEAYCRYDDTDGGDKGRRIHLFITGQQ
jgi:hypothetical protein